MVLKRKGPTLKSFYANVLETGSLITLELRRRDSSGELIDSLPIIRAKLEHRSFIISTWVKSYQSQARRIRYESMPVPHDVYRDGESLLAELRWKDSHVVVSPGDEFTIHAWICSYSTPGAKRLYHVYVPPLLRSSRVAKSLVEHYVGKEYLVGKPWPNAPPSGHVVHFDPYMNGAGH